MAIRGHRPVRVSEDTSVLIPAVLAAVTIALCASVLPALAGPFILPEFKAARYAVLVWTLNGLLWPVMGFLGSVYRKPQSIGIVLVLTTLAGAGGALFYTRLGLLAPVGLCVGLGAGGGLVLGAAGALIGARFVEKSLLPAVTFIVILVLALGGQFLRTGSVSGKASRPVNQVTLGMMTGQQDEPVPGVPVVLTRMDGKTRLYETRTNDAGNYVFNGPTPGEYMLFVEDVEPGRGSGEWVKSKVTAGALLSGVGLGTGNISLPTYRQETKSPFLDKAPTGPPAQDPASRADRTGGGTQGQMNRLLDDAVSKRGY